MGIRILVVEDDVNDVFLVRRACERSALDVNLQVVNDGIKARDYLAGHGIYADRQLYPQPCGEPHPELPKVV